jgi:pimeloyl-ACP methyl ester carboxylesterase
MAAVLGLAAALLAGCSGSTHQTQQPAPATSGSTASQIHWVKCRGGTGPKGYQCATVMVPRDPKNPALGNIPMAIDRRPASGHKIGSLFTNPGGPGVSGVDSLPSLVQEMPSSLLDRFDIIGFDPPGVARSAPINCLDDVQLAQYFDTDPAPTTQAGFDHLVSEARTLATGCQSSSAAELPYVSTVDAAMDMDILRQAVGDAKLNYLGFSYGTELGATYAGLYPTKVRAMVLDGDLDPANPVITQLEQQSASLQAQLEQMFSQCTSAPSCPWHPGPDPEAAFLGLVAKVRSDPVSVPGTSRTVGPAQLLYGAAWGLYFPQYWKFLEQGLQQLSNGNGSDILELFDSYNQRNPDGTYSNLFEVNEAVNCLDSPAPTISSLQAALPAAEAASPVFGELNLYSEVGCAVWPVPATGTVGPIRAAGSPPIVVVGSTGDPVTPYPWAEALAHQLEHGVLLTRVGDGHTAYMFSSCIRTDVDTYLIDLTVPAAGTRCRSD